MSLETESLRREIVRLEQRLDVQFMQIKLLRQEMETLNALLEEVRRQRDALASEPAEEF